MKRRERRMGALVCVLMIAAMFGSIDVARAATITVTDLTGALQPADLANSLAGSGVTVSNVTYPTGTDLSAGSFTGGTSTIGFDSGIILSSGYATDAVGPNDSDSLSQSVGTGGDADLDAIEAGTEDATVLEFDVTPDDDHLSFNYVFASEEYNEYVNSQFNDVFAFFVGAAKVNCAVVADGPDAGTDPDPVSINTVNNGNPLGAGTISNAALYRNNDPGDGGTIDIEPDGLTVVLQCAATVLPDVPNHLKLAIADRGDSGYDSWVFIQAGSITTTPLEICDNGIDDDGDTFIDGADPDCVIQPPDDSAVSGTKFYDANTNGTQDVGEPGIVGWNIDVTNGGTTTVATGVAGAYQLAVAEGTYDVSEQDGGATWHQTAPVGGFYDDVVVGSTEVTDLDFGNVCVGAGNARSKGFWTNKNGQAAFAVNSAGALSMLNALNLKGANGQDVTFANYGAVKTWLTKATSKNSAYMLSAQLAAMKLNVFFGFVNPSALIYAPGATSANAAGFATVLAVTNEANTALGAATPVRSYQLVLSGILDRANNNLTFAQANLAACAPPVFVVS